MTALRNPLKHDPAAAADFTPNLARNWFILISVAILVSYLYAFLEGSFFITQPSYATVSTNLFIKITVLFFSGFIISAAFACLLIALFLIFRFIPGTVIQRFGINAGRLVLAFLLACLALLLIDNFTYSIFKFGIISSTGIWRAAYAILFLCLLIIAYFQCAPLVRPLSETAYRKKTWQLIAAFGLLLASVLFVLTTYLNEPTQAANSGLSDITADENNLPNIILIGSDGVNASSMSLYGYQRDTTPNLSAFASQALVAANAFHNANTSTGSDTSLLTGKLPTTTRVVYPPDILLGDNAIEHLPGILKQRGYRTVEIAMPHYVDAYSVNFREGFDLVNGRSIDNYPALYLGWKLGGDYPAYFIGITAERILSRLKHIFFIKEMENPFEQVTTGYGLMMTDQERIDQLIAFLQNRDQPLFAHVHLLGTHGPYYFPVNPYFSMDQVQTEPAETDFYDDAIRDFDAYLAQLMTFLQESGLKDDTIVVIYSDHGKDLTFDRVPLVFFFPDSASAGVITTNSQNLDVAPTLLDYLNLPIPPWMEGDSLLSSKLTVNRRIFIPGVNFDKFSSRPNWNEIDTAQIDPPFFQFGKLRLVVCDRYYQVDLTTRTWSESRVEGHSAPCDPGTLPTLAEARLEMLEQLSSRGFDVSSLQN